MINLLKSFVRSIPTLLLSFALAIAVWISAVTAADPTEQRLFPRPVTIERINLDPSLVISSDVPTQATVTISAPSSIWDRMINDRSPVRAWIDFAGLGPGEHTLPVEVRTMQAFQPSKVVNQSPQMVNVVLERLVTKEFPIRLIRRGEPAIGYQAEEPGISQNTVTVSGPSSLVERVAEVRVVIDLTQASDTINRNVDVQVVDEKEAVVEGVNVVPEQVTLNQPITQRGGYRNVVVRVTTTGQVASGYRLTNIAPFPPNVTVFSSNPLLIDRLPGVVETSPLDLTGLKDDIDVPLPLNLPDGVEVVGDQNVLVQVGVTAIEGSVTLTGLPVTQIGLSEDLTVRTSPETVDVIISGPVPQLDRLTDQDVRVLLDLSGVEPGTYQFAPRVSLGISELRVESILPGSIEVVVEEEPPPGRRTPTPTPTRTPTAEPTEEAGP